MDEEFVNIIKLGNEKSIKKKLNIFLSLTEKTMTILSSLEVRIDDLESQIDVLRTRIITQESKTEPTKAVTKSNVESEQPIPTHEPVGSVVGPQTTRRALISELKELFKIKTGSE